MLEGDELESIYKDMMTQLKKLDSDFHKNLQKINTGLNKKFQEFANRYKRLFNMIIENRFKEKYSDLFLRLHEDKLNKTEKKRVLFNHENLYYDIVSKKKTLEIFKTIHEIQVEQDIRLQDFNEEKQKNIEKLKEHFKKKYPEFEKNHNSLFTGILKGEFEENIMLQLIDSYKKFRNNTLSEHDASVRFGQVLVDKLVKPMLDKNKK